LITSKFVHLRQDGVSLLVSLASDLVQVLHWGSDLGADADFQSILSATTEPTAHAEGDLPEQHGIWREAARSTTGAPALSGHRNGQDFSPLFALESFDATDTTLVVHGVDRVAGLGIETSFRFVGAGVLVTATSVTNLAS